MKEIPETGKIVLPGEQLLWPLLAAGHIDNLITSGQVTAHNGKPIRISLVLTKIILPSGYNYEKKAYYSIEGGLEEKISLGHLRICEYMMNILYSNVWILFGYIDDDKNRPIVINHFPKFSRSFYTLDLNKETIEASLPQHQLN